MSISAKRVILPLIAVAFVAAISAIGFYLGRRASPPMMAPPPELPTETIGQKDNIDPPRIIDTPYHIAQPTMGLLQQTVRLDLSASGLDAQSAPDASVQIGMMAILYDAHGSALPDKARVVRSDDDGIALELPPHLNKPVRADVIIAQHDLARRLPLSAQMNGIVWKATPHPDGSIVLSRIDVPAKYLHSDTLFHVGNLRADDYVLIDPSADLREGDILTNVYPVEFDAPVADAAHIAKGKIEELRQAAFFHQWERDDRPSDRIEGGAVCEATTSFPIETP